MPRPSPNESEKDFVARCIPHLIKEEGLEQEHAVGKCFGIFRHYSKAGNTAAKDGYGVCPKCGMKNANGTVRERRINGTTTCGNCGRTTLTKEWETLRNAKPKPFHTLFRSS